MKIVRITLFAVGAGLLVAQVFRPEKNNSSGVGPRGFEQQFAVSSGVREILLNSCYDCHSNKTRYPWYVGIQPVGWWLSGHIEDGKDELNFDEFGTYRPRRQFVKFREIEKMIVEEEMPLPSYAFVHRDAILSEEQKGLVIDWSRAMRDSMEMRYPPDSLARRLIQ